MEKFLNFEGLKHYYEKTKITVNGVAPDKSRDIKIPIPEEDDLVKSVNGVKPDDHGNVTLDIPEAEGSVRSVNGVEADSSGNVNVSKFSSNKTINLTGGLAGKVTTDFANDEISINANLATISGITPSMIGPTVDYTVKPGQIINAVQFFHMNNGLVTQAVNRKITLSDTIYSEDNPPSFHDISGVLSPEQGGTGLTSLDDLKTAFNVPNIILSDQDISSDQSDYPEGTIYLVYE